ncbi:uncharacterized protein C5orf34 homolog isoform X2 [Pezoporus occidentalis]|uniref:uncharacterized protein C5orf34 homolog isoform X2 n=1 Tax=Pezoporus occidentalis TaxID=407982 RepID=UPI002F915475
MAERLMVLYGDDSAEVHYAGGARLLLSPCGCEYRYEAARPAASHQLQPAQSTRQRTAFCRSAHRERLVRALDFRNRFSSRPYLPSHVIPPERKKIIFRDILEIRWPDPTTADLTRCADNGSVKISSVDGYAHLYLSELQQEFTVQFLCKVSQSSAASLHASEKNSNCQTRDQYGKSRKNPVAEMSLKQMRIEGKKNDQGCAEGKYRESTNPEDQRDRDGVPLFYMNHSCEYIWVTQCWSVSSYPEEWKYPLSLALMCYNLNNAKRVMQTCEKKNHASMETDVLIDPGKKETVSHLPTALPLSCRAPHLHRFIHGRKNIIEIYPGDDSVLKSEGTLFGNYFIHYAIQKGTKKREEKMYSVNSLPPDVPGNSYSISSIITQATKILQNCYKTKLSLTHNYYLCCWKMVPETDGREMLPVLLYEKVIPSIGRLIVYSDHKVHAAFWDGVTLNMVWDFSSCYSKIQINEDVGWCKLTTSDGLQQLIQISHPGIYERYTRTAIKWCRSLNERKEIPEYTEHSVTEENWSADVELEKIQRFNLLLDNSNVLEGTSAAKTNPSSLTVRKTENESEPEGISEGYVLEALEKTSKVIHDIESLLAACGR